MKSLRLAFLFLCLSATATAQSEPAMPARWFDLLAKVVEINSGSENLEGLERVRQVLIPAFEAVGFRAKVHPVGDGGRKVVSFEFPGAKPELLLVGHIDTVFSRDSAFQKVKREEGRISGPGVIDMKGGIVLMLQVLSELGDEGLLRRVRVVLNDDEEIGSAASLPKLKELAAGIPAALVFEPGLPGGDLVTSHSGVYWFEARAKGKASHAGLDHAAGINACTAISALAVDISKWTNYAQRLTVNVGSLAGGTKPNVVCADASLRADVRFVGDRALNEFRARLDRRLARSGGARLSREDIVLIPSMPESSTAKLFALAREEGKALGQRIRGRHVGYASDANGLAPTGIQLLVGLGPTGENPHAETEFMDLNSYRQRLALNKALVRRILQ